MLNLGAGFLIRLDGTGTGSIAFGGATGVVVFRGSVGREVCPAFEEEGVGRLPVGVCCPDAVGDELEAWASFASRFKRI